MILVHKLTGAISASTIEAWFLGDTQILWAVL
jgi:hypothetical protein